MEPEQMIVPEQAPAVDYSTFSRTIGLIGPQGVGKSSLAGALLAESNSLTPTEMQRRYGYTNNVPNPQKYAHLLDDLTNERENSMTIIHKREWLKLPNRVDMLVDTPGSVSHVPNCIRGITLCEHVIMVISADEEERMMGWKHMKYGFGREYIVMLVGLGFRRIVWAINKMDRSNTARRSSTKPEKTSWRSLKN